MNKFFGILVLLISFISCSSDLDFNQSSDLKVNPVFVGNLGSFDFQAPQFVSSGIEQTLVSDTFLFDIAKYKDLTENLSRAELDFEFTNTINRAYLVSINFLDDKDVKVLPSILMTVPAYSGSPNQVTRKEIFENTELDKFRLTHKIGFEVLMLPGTPLTNTSLGSLKMRSSATIYFLTK